MKNDLPEEKPLCTFSFRERRESSMVRARAQKAEVSTEQRAPLYRKDVRGPRAIGESGGEGRG